MEKVSLVFHSNDVDEPQVQLTAFCNINNEIYLEIRDKSKYNEISYITLDRLTAIRFVKHLKKEISFINPLNEDSNG